MSSYEIVDTEHFGSDNWCLSLQPLYNHALLTALSNGEVHHLDWVTNKSMKVDQAGNSSISKLKIINSDFHAGSLYAVAANDSINVFDIRSKEKVAMLKNDKNVPFLSLDSRHGMLACGTELCGVDAEVYIYDIRNWNSPVRSFVDSHHDDVTDIRFHPTDPQIFLSGSTDGYTNVYDMRQEEEEDALHQVINYASIHSCGWLAPKRIFTLSHMETFAIHELNDKSDELTEPHPLDFGDIRNSWGCNYVVDIYPGYIAVGSSQVGSSSLKLLAFENEKVHWEDPLVIPSAHGEEVVRDVLIPSQNSDMLYSCGEDGSVKAWKTQNCALRVEEGFWDYSKTTNVFAETATGDSSSHGAQKMSEDEHFDNKLSASHRTKKKIEKPKAKNQSKSRRYKPY